MNKSTVEAASRRARGDPSRTEGQRLGEYYPRRVETHRRGAPHAPPSALTAYETLAEGHVAAVVGSECGEMVQFARDRRGERPEEEQ